MNKNNIFNNFEVAAKQLKKELIVLRRRLHQHPELGFSEFRTSSIISKQLKNSGLKVKTLAGTGLVGFLAGKGSGCVALRAEMDAMPIQEKRTGKYASSVPGVMHACGHDVHMAIAIGVASVLSKFSNLLKGSVKFIFQPSEEVLPGRKSGAQEMVNAGVLSNSDVDAVFTVHSLPELHVGKIEIGYGPVTASAETFHIRILGESSHVAFQEKAKDAILASAEIINSLYHIVPRRIAPHEPAVLNIGMIKGGEAESIIADCVDIRGTIRAINKKTHETIKRLIKNYVSGICASYGVKYKLEFMDFFPAVINDKRLNKLSETVGKKLLGDKNIISSKCQRMIGDDFSKYTQKIPGLYIKLGTAEGNSKNFPLHHPMFDVDEKVIPVGVSLISSIIYEYLKEGK